MSSSRARARLSALALLIVSTLLLLQLASRLPAAAAFRPGALFPTGSKAHCARRPVGTALFSSSSPSSASAMSEIKVVHSPDEATIVSMGIKSWPTWGCEASKFPWAYGDSETCYILQDKVTVTPTGGKPVTVGKGDLVTFPEGMSCVWDVHEAIKKHYKFH